MPHTLLPLFDTVANLADQTIPFDTTAPNYCVSDYQHAKAFLLSYNGHQGTFNAYRREVERILHWAWTFTLFGYAPIGKRCYGQRNWHAKGRINITGAFLSGSLLATCLFNCNIDSDVFHVWINCQLLPQLSQRSVIVLDNATFHKRKDTQKSIRDAGHILEYLPPYSPDLNPIEHKWAQAKAIRKQKQCSVHESFKKFIS